MIRRVVLYRTVPMPVANRIVCNALERIGVAHRVLSQGEVEAQTDFEHTFHVCITTSKNGKKRLLRKKGTASSTHYTICIWPNTTYQKAAEILGRYVESLRRGWESEAIGLEAGKLASTLRPDLIADFYKTGELADRCGSDFRLGICKPYGRILWIGIDVKSSWSGMRKAIERLQKKREQNKTHGKSPDEYLVRVIAVDQNGSRKERVESTALTIIREAKRIRDMLAR